jgi:hypothetical protein
VPATPPSYCPLLPALLSPCSSPPPRVSHSSTFLSFFVTVLSPSAPGVASFHCLLRAPLRCTLPSPCCSPRVLESASGRGDGTLVALMLPLGDGPGGKRARGSSAAILSFTFAASLSARFCVYTLPQNVLCVIYCAFDPATSPLFCTWLSRFLRASGYSAHRVRGPGSPLSIRRATTVGGRMRFGDADILASLSLPVALCPLRSRLLLCLLHWPAPQPCVYSALAVLDLGILCSTKPAMLAAQKIVGIVYRRHPLPTLPSSCVYSAPDVPNLGILCSI